MKVCKELENNDHIVNYHMKVSSKEDNDFHYTYLLSQGISKTKGGIKVLKDMNYPKEILENMIR
jgi:DNA mismatch repair ATPase MutS